MSALTPVDRLYQESSSTVAALGANEPSLSIAASDIFRKALVLACASNFEHRVCSCVMDWVHECASGNGMVVGLVKSKAVSRQYHTWFVWTDSNANSFFALFGADFKQLMIERVRHSEQLRESIRAFLELGNERNKMVHQDFASFPLDKTLDEIYALYRRASEFVDSLPALLRTSPAVPQDQR